MPGLDGFALAAALRADSLTRHVPILGMTAHWTSDTQSNGHRAGFSAMLLKPCLPTHLLAEIERVLQSAKSAAAEVGRETTEVESALPVGLRNAGPRRRGVDY